MSLQQANKIEEEVLKPFRERQMSLEIYEQALSESKYYENVSNELIINELNEFQRALGLRNEDVEFLKNNCLENYAKSDTLTSFTKENHITPLSECNIDYSTLRDLLSTNNWREADQETRRIILKIFNREKEGKLALEHIKAFPVVFFSKGWGKSSVLSTTCLL